MIAWPLALAFVAVLAWDGWRRHIAERARTHVDRTDEVLRQLVALEAKVSETAEAVTSSVDALESIKAVMVMGGRHGR